ncbi:MAG: hypothetical protein ACAI44_21880 [Candidatus Sericytochromatia bacterium]
MSKQKTDLQAKKQEKWLASFEAASPRQRHAKLLELLAEGPDFLERDTLVFAVATVNEMLARNNLLTEMSQLSDTLRERVPEAYVALIPALNMFSLEEALFLDQGEKLPPLLQGFLDFPDPLPDDIWLIILDKLALHGQAGQAAALATGLSQKFGAEQMAEESLLNARITEHRLLWAIETFWRGPGGEADKRAFDEVVTSFGYDDQELVGILYQQRDASMREQLDVLLDKFHRRATFSAVHNGQMAFGRWMLEKYGLNLYTSSEIMTNAVMIWRMNPDRDNKDLKLERLVRLTREQMNEYLESMAEDPELSLDELAVFCWGLPLVYDWLKELGLVQAKEAEKLVSWLADPRKDFVSDAESSLWTYDFVHRWPRPAGMTESAFAAESARFRASHDQSQPLSDDPADSALFDDDPFALEMPEEAEFDLMLRQLAGLGPAEREKLLKMLADEFGQEAATEIQAMLAQPSATLQLLVGGKDGKAGQKQEKSKGKSTAKPKAKSQGKSHAKGKRRK